MSHRHRTSLVASVSCALAGLGHVLAHERNARIHLAAAAVAVALGLWLRLALLEWALIVVAIALVFTGEMLNTVVETVVDMITPERCAAARCAKDVAAGAILFASLAALVIGMLVFGPRLYAHVAPLLD